MDLFNLDNEALATLGLPPLVMIAALAITGALLITLAVALLKQFALAIKPTWKEGRWWKLTIRILSLALGALAGWWLVDDLSVPGWGLAIGTIVGGFATAIRAFVKVQATTWIAAKMKGAS